MTLTVEINPQPDPRGQGQDWGNQLGFSDLEQQNGLPDGWLQSVMQAESAGNPDAVSPAGAQGLFQFMPTTAQQYGIDPTDPQQAAQGAAKYYGDLFKKYNGDPAQAAAAYNWGPGNVDKHGLEQAPAETQGYVKKILGALPAAGKQIASALTGAGEAQAAEPDYDNMSLEDLQNLQQQVFSKNQEPDYENLSLEQLEAYQDKLNRQNLEPANAVSIPGPKPLFTQPDKSDPDKRPLIGDLGDQGLVTQLVAPTINAFGNNGALPIADEVGGGLMGLKALAQGRKFSEGYDEGADAINGVERAYEQQYPRQALATSGAGQVIGLGALGPLGKLGSMARSGLQAIAPTMASKVAQLVASHPKTTASALGALGGGARGYLAATGDDRNSSAVHNAAAGAVLGFGGNYFANKIASSGPNAALNRLVTPRIEPTIGTAGDYASIAPEASKILEDRFTKTVGERTQSQAAQEMEAAARAGNITPEAKQAADVITRKQNSEYKDLIDELAGEKNVTKNGDINQLVDSVASTIQSEAKNAKSGVDALYADARLGQGVKISRKDVQGGLWQAVRQARQEGAYDLTQMPNARSVVQRLAKYSRDVKGTRLTSIKLGELENFRKQASQAIQRSNDPTEKGFLRSVVKNYDNFMEETAEKAVDIGDKDAINAFKNAVKSRREFGRLFESNKLVQDIVSGEKSIDDVARSLVGAGDIKGKSGMANNLQAILKAAGNESDKVKGDLQAAFARKIYERARTKSFEPGNPNELLISPTELANQLESVFIKQSEFANELFGKGAADEAPALIKELRLIASKQPGVISTSGSGELVRKALQRMTKVIGRIPVVGPVLEGAEALAKAGTRGKEAKLAIKSLQGIETAPKSKMFTRINPKSAVTGSLISPIISSKEKK